MKCSSCRAKIRYEGKICRNCGAAKAVDQRAQSMRIGFAVVGSLAGGTAGYVIGFAEALLGLFAGALVGLIVAVVFAPRRREPMGIEQFILANRLRDADWR